MQPRDQDSNFYRPRLALFTIAGFVLLAGLWLWLTAFPLNGAPQRFKVAFHQVNGLHKNSAVYIDGVRVGTIEDVVLRGPKTVLVSAMVNQHDVVVPTGSRFYIRANGLVGAKYLDIELPETVADAQPLNEKSVAAGVDPVRTEIVMEQLQDKLERADFAEIAEDLRHVRVAADDVSYLSHKLNPLADRAVVMEDNISLLASDLRHTTRRFDGMLNDRRFSGDLKTIANTAKDAAEHLDNAMARVQSVAGDKESMQNVSQALATLDEATQNVRETVARIEVIGADKELRGDAKQIVADAKDTVLQVDKMVGRPAFGANLKSTLAEAKEAFHRMAFVGAQLEQILDKRAPLLHMMVGRPGHLDERSRVAGKEKSFE